MNAGLKIGCLVAGTAAGADSIEDMDVLRHGAMGELFSGIRAPSTLGSFLRSFTWGNVRQLDAVARRVPRSAEARRDAVLRHQLVLPPGRQPLRPRLNGPGRGALLAVPARVTPELAPAA